MCLEIPNTILFLSLLTINDPVFRLVAVVWGCTVRHEYHQQIRSRGEYLWRQVRATVAANKSSVGWRPVENRQAVVLATVVWFYPKCFKSEKNSLLSVTRWGCCCCPDKRRAHHVIRVGFGIIRGSYDLGCSAWFWCPGFVTTWCIWDERTDGNVIK